MIKKLLKNGFYAGTFDFFHDGHAAVLRSALKLFDSVVVGIGINPTKTPITPVKERIRIINKFSDVVLGRDAHRMQVSAYDTPLVRAARVNNCGFIVRGLRNHDDFGDEMLLANTNRDVEEAFGTLDEDKLETIWIPKGLSISSTLLKQVILLNDDQWEIVFKRYVPPCIFTDLLELAKKYRASIFEPKEKHG
jgi:pantetheine-phosphate adenylyltransferase